MTIIESGIIAGALSGASIGARIGAGHGLWTRIAGAGGGLITGAAAGWLFAMILIVLLSFVGVLWRAARKRSADPPTESDMRTMTPIAVAGTFISALASLTVLTILTWQAALITLAALTCLTALGAVARCELRRVRISGPVLPSREK
jgi:hypothetical protein